MEKNLRDKLELKTNYCDDEISWCLQHIGDKNPNIRDHIVYISFCEMLLNSRIDQRQFKMIKDYCLAHLSLENQKLSTLTKSFTALVLALMIDLDNNSHSIFYNLLSTKERKLIFQQAFTFLNFEKDIRGFDSNYGWIHTIAHGADLMYYCIQHRDFSSHDYVKIFPTILKACHQKQGFSAGEEMRLAETLVYLIKEEKISDSDVINFLKSIEWEASDDMAYFKSLNIFRLLSCLYIRLSVIKAVDNPILRECLELLQSFEV